MSPGTLTKVEDRTAPEICEHYSPSKAVLKLLRPDQTPRDLVEALVQAGEYVAAFSFLAHALPKREAIWWACLAVRHTQGAALPPKELAALGAAVAWVLEPDESRRRAAQAAG